jgi:hypothetical protein
LWENYLFVVSIWNCASLFFTIKLAVSKLGKVINTIVPRNSSAKRKIIAVNLTFSLVVETKSKYQNPKMNSNRKIIEKKCLTVK